MLAWFLTNEFTQDAFLLSYNVSRCHVLALKKQNVLRERKGLFKNQCCDKNTILLKNKLLGLKEDPISGER